MKIAPCKGCEKREPGCHSSCETYKTWKQETTDEREAFKKLFNIWRGDFSRRKIRK